jgi:YegS/Rv2252/BmrU family lipid kinase
MPVCDLTEEELAAMQERKLTVKKVRIIVNPFSGNGKARVSIKLVLAELEKRGVEHVLHETEYALHATELASSLSFDGFQALIAIGGDGTFNEVITGLMERKDGKEARPVLGLIAGGTGNSVLTTFGLLDPTEATGVICDGLYRGLDIGEVLIPDETTASGKTTKYTVNVMGWGLGVDANVTAEGLRCCGPVRYDVGAVWNIVKNPLRELTCTIDGETLTGTYAVLMIQNNIHAGSNMRIAPYAKADDGYLDGLFCKQLGRKVLVNMFGELKRDGCHIFLDDVDYRQFVTLELASDPVTLINVDGENIPSTPFTLTCLYRELNVFFPLKVAPN